MTKNWTSDDLAKLRGLIAQGYTVAQASRALGRNADAVKYAMRRNDIRGYKTMRYTLPRFWTDAKVAELVERFGARQSFKVIAAAIGCTPGGARNKISQLRCEGAIPDADSQRAAVQVDIAPPREIHPEPVALAMLKQIEGCAKLAAAINRLGGHRDVVRPVLTFEQKLALVGAGKLRVVEQRPIVTYVGECFPRASSMVRG